MEPTDVKVDKRTKEYKESIAETTKKVYEEEAKYAKREGYKPRTELFICPKCNGTGSGEGCMEQGGFVVGLCPECCGNKMWVKGEKVVEEKIETEKDGIDYSKAVNNPGFKLCSECGCELPPNEDGTPKWRKYPEPCHDCIWKNNK